MHIYYSDVFSFPLPANHRFPRSKYSLLRKRISTVFPDLTHNLILSPAASDQELLLAHNDEYITKVLHGKLTPKEVRRIGFPWSQELVTRSRHSVGGTIARPVGCCNEEESHLTLVVVHTTPSLITEKDFASSMISRLQPGASNPSSQPIIY